MLGPLALVLSSAFSGRAVQERPASEIVAGDLGAKLDAYLERCEAFGFSGSVLVTRGGNVILAKGFGLADRERGLANAPDTLFEIASTSKQFTAAAVLKLEAEGKLRTADPISKHLPGVPADHRAVTIQHLLTHTSGFSRMGPGPGGPDLETAVRGYLGGKRLAEPGARFEYWNGGYALLAGIVERASGMPFTEYCRKRLFEPAGMAQTGFCGEKALDALPLAHGYEEEKDVGSATAHSFGWEYRGMGGVVTSVLDLHRWDRALEGGKVLPPEALAKLYAPSLENYACGWWVTRTPRGTRRVEHGGSVAGFESELIRFVDEGATVALLANRSGVHWQVGYNLANLLFGEPFKAPAPPEVMRIEPERLKAFEGIYEAGPKARLVIRTEGPGLLIGAEGQEAIGWFEPGGSRGPFERERSLALSVLQGLSRGDVSEVRNRVPKEAFWAATWPDQLRTSLWPKHLEKWGPLASLEEVGARTEPDGRSVRVWVRLRHEKGPAAAEVAFQGDRLTILDLKGREFPAMARYAPTSGTTFESYDFGRPAGPTMAFEAPGGGAPRRLVLALPGGKRIVLERRRRGESPKAGLR
ncbi:MAG TPA: serine hydrolase domain-containing protein [Planctomycetota bacterium]|jgi:CubicO group peptidase (beta-lactamase class C family)|nr:serine hydrolase domain-containing protein [Planctomycetota bacterium]